MKQITKRFLCGLLIISLLAGVSLNGVSLMKPIVAYASTDEASYTYLSFQDYQTSAGEDLVSPVTVRNIESQTSRVDTLNGVIFSGEITFNKSGNKDGQAIRIGGYYSNGENHIWEGIFLYISGTSLKAYNYYTKDDIKIGTASVNEPVKVSMQFDKVEEGKWKVVYTINDGTPTEKEYTQTQDFGKYMVLYTANNPANNISDGCISFTSTKGNNPIQEMYATSYNLDDGPYLVTGEVKDADGNVVDVDSDNLVLTEPGDYTVMRWQGSFGHSQQVSLYRMGDVNLDGIVGEQDLLALQALLKEKKYDYKVNSAADYAADLNNDEKVGQKDVQLLTDVLDTNSATTLEAILDKYHVPALTFDYLGGDEVMPITGFYGPYKDGTHNYINEKTFQLIKESGINLISYSKEEVGRTTPAVLQLLELAEKSGIGYFVEDWNLNPEYTIANRNDGTNATDIPIGSDSAPTIADVAGWISKYDHYQSYLGIHVVDEPLNNKLDETAANYNKQLKFYDWTSYTLNQFTNQQGFINLWDASLYDNYDEFCDDYVVNTKTKVLSYDNYHFAYGGDISKQGTVAPFYSVLWAARQEAQEHDIPLWAYVEAGGDFRDGHITSTPDAATNKNKLPTEAETNWSVNNYLAFGAKGIEWFTLIQPEYQSKDSSSEDGHDYDRSGVLGADGETTPFYPWIQKINKHIAAVDEVLMKSKSVGIMATGSTTRNYMQYGKRDNLGITKLLDGVELDDDGTDMLRSIESTGQQYGAVVGCFEYRDTEAFYVVNYDVNNSQSITLNFRNNYKYRYVAEAQGYTGKGDSLTLNVGPGQGVLVVLDEQTDETTEQVQPESVRFVGSQVTLGGKLSIDFYAVPLWGTSMEDTYMLLEFPDGETKMIPTPTEKTEYGYRFSHDIVAKEMADVIAVQIFDKNGKAISEKQEYSVRAYAETIIENSGGYYTIEQVNLAKAMLNYGAYVQTYFNHNVDNLANANLRETDVSHITANRLINYKKTVVPSHPNIGTFAGASLVLEQETTLKLYFSLEEDVDVEHITFTLTLGDTETALEAVESGEYYYVSIPNIAANNLDKDYRVTVSNGTDSFVAEYSAMTYCYHVLSRDETDIRTEELKNVARAMYLYSYAAEICFDMQSGEDETPFEPI